MKIIKKYLIISLCLLLMACGSTKNSDNKEVTKSNTEIKESEEEKAKKEEELKKKKILEDVFRSYVKILENHKDYAEDKEKAEYSKYWYSLAYMDKTDIPVLLLKMNSNFKYDFQGPSTMKLFGFVNGQAKELSYKTLVGEAQAGYSRIIVNQLEDNNGLHITSVNTGGQDGIFYKLQFENEDIKVEETPFKIENNTIKLDAKVRELTWNEIDDYTALEEMLGENKDFIKQFNEEYLKNLKEGQKVYEGTLKIFTEPELLEFQKMKHPNPGYEENNSLYVVFVLNSPQELWGQVIMLPEGRTSKMDSFAIFAQSKYRSVELNNRIEMFKKYKDKKVKVIVDENKSWWPTDTSLPLGMLRGGVIKIID